MLAFVENKTITARLQARGEITAPIKLCYVDIDSKAIEHFGNFPWNRQLHAFALDALFTQGHAKAVGFDLVFSDAGEPNLGRSEAKEGSLAFGKSIRQHGNVVLGATYTTSDRVFPTLAFNPGKVDQPEMPNFPIFGPTWGEIGLIDTLANDRFMPLYAPTEQVTYYPMALRLALKHWGVGTEAISISDNEMRIRNAEGTELARIPLSNRQLVEINWFLPWHSPRNFHVSFLDVLRYGQMAESDSAEEKAEAATFFEAFRDAFVLVGPTDALLRDLSQSPIDGALAVPRVSFHGNMLKTLVSGRFLHRPPAWANALITSLLGLITAALCLQEKRSGWKKIMAGALIVLYVAAAFLTFSWFDLILPIVAPVGNALCCSFFAVLWQLGVEERKRTRIKALFGSFVSPEIVKEMVDNHVNPQVGGVEEEITAFFSDIEAFSPLSEELTPSELVDLMNQYLGECTTAIIKHRGTLDKYIGDAIVAIFGVPIPSATHAAAACHAALDVQAAQAALRDRWLKEGNRWPVRAHVMRTRIGLNSGEAVVGHMGSTLRINYTMMGDNVNLTQRLEAAAAFFGADILTSTSTRTSALEHDANLIFRHLDRVTVPGRNKPVEIHELLGHRDNLDKGILHCMEAYASALEHYFRGQWSDALVGFKISSELERRKGLLNPSTLMIHRCERFLATPPPADWNFAYKLSKGD